jgi:hypothetical protein
VLSAAVAFRIVMGAAAARPVSLAVEMVPVADAACRPVAQACFAMARMTVHNTSARPVLLDWYFVELSREGKSGYHGIFPSASLDPGTTIEIRDVEFELHTEAVHTLRVAYHLDGERPGSRGHVSSGRWLWLQDAALAACKRCNGGKEEQCACETGDRNRRCTEAAQCRGVCIFDRFEEVPAPVCTPRPGMRCPIPFREGFRVGHCSETIAPLGCIEALSKDDSPARPIALPAGHSSRCYPAAERFERPPVTESSRRR